MILLKKTWLGFSVVCLILMALLSFSTLPTHAAGQTVVTIGFDDGNADQYTARAILSAHNMRATFFVNTGVIGDATHLSWTQLSDLYADGNEIAGHTLTHANLKKLKTAALRQEICGDRVNLFNHGFQPASFAYPFGSYDSAAVQTVKDCGYNSARTVSQGPDIIPPHDPYATWAMPSVKNSTSVATMEGWVTQTEQAGGGWVQLVIHHVCNNCDVYSITPADFNVLLDWLQTHGTVVKTTTEVIGGIVKPPVNP
jgi:peptidoglycan/xylan/chitin deacetylase (PgdA/CDA1 family)